MSEEGPLHIIHVAAEMAGVAKVGGLGDVIHGLSRELTGRGHQVEVIMPKYTCLNYAAIEDLQVVYKDLWSFGGGSWHHNTVWAGWIEGIKIYFIEPHVTPEYFDREHVYGYPDDTERFTYFARAAMEFLLKSQTNPDILHLHEWQAALAAPLYWELFRDLGLNNPRIVFTMHNLQYQGQCSPYDLDRAGLCGEKYLTPEKLQDDNDPHVVNLTKGAIVYSNAFTTVSPTYAKEVQTVEGGHQLHRTILQHRDKFEGILNGLNYEHWGAGVDRYLPCSFEPKLECLDKKAQIKEELRHRFGLAQEDRPLVASISRLVPQKGVHLIRRAIFRTLDRGGQFVLLGSASTPEIAREFHGLKVRFGDNPHVHLELHPHEELTHLIYGGADMFVVPSLFEPCGLTQLIALRYGTVPIVRATGGLADTIFDVDSDFHPLEKRNGYVFVDPSDEGICSALDRALDCWLENRPRWKQIMLRGMIMDYSWKAPAEKYEAVYRRARKGARPLSEALAAPTFSTVDMDVQDK